ncbi:PTS fructose transporter subunit IIC [Lacrimispora sp.]|uniref:PTS fructose transporter subunit IIC n=1 Tax=Lacrimispora sp. TaxID=2719234 RepID=UPI0028AD77FB|nr:PTS fructose transporter subunit IIC [Lacrimispora sp.]
MMGFKLSEIKKHIMTGISFMIPIVVGAGLCMALGTAIGGTKVSEAEGTLIWFIWKTGKIGMSFVVPVITAAIAYSIADKPAIAPGLILGAIATEIYTGFIGGIIAAFLVGYTVLFLKRHLKVPKTMQGLMPVLILPFLTALISGSLMYAVIGKPVASVMSLLQNWLLGLQGGSKFIMGAIVGGMCGVDFGGPIGKTASLFANGLLVDGIYGPEAVKLVTCMIPPIGVTLSWVLTKNKYTKAEKEAIKAAFPMGICMITEGVIPLAMNDPLRVIGSSVIATSIAGGLTMMLGIENYVTAGGWFIIPLSNKPLLMAGMVLLGGIIMGVILSVWKKTVTEDESMDFGLELGNGEVSSDGINFENI